MPYADKSELPKGVQNSLPAHAQDIYRKAYNRSWHSENNLDDTSSEKEEKAHRIAWAAVKQQYQHTDEGWQKK